MGRVRRSARRVHGWSLAVPYWLVVAALAANWIFDIADR